MSELGGQTENPYASPQSEEAPVVSNPTPAWRDGELVVVAPDGELPRRCAKCGGEASGKILKLRISKEVQSWKLNLKRFAIIFGFGMMMAFAMPLLMRSLPGIWPQLKANQLVATIFPAFFGLAMGAALYLHQLFNRPHLLRYSYCWRHRLAFPALWLWCAVVCMGSFASPLLKLVGFDLRPLFAIVPMFPLLAVLPIIFISRSLVQPKTMQKRNDFVWLSGFGKPFVDSLPEFPPELAIKHEEEH